jgi:hypothetical protein
MRPDIDWKQQRDRLLADTPAFVRHVAEQQTAAPVEPAPTDPVEIAPPAVFVPPPPRLPIQTTTLRDDIRARVDGFRARQQKLQAVRDAHYDQAIGRVRAVTQHWRQETGAAAFLATPSPVQGMSTNARKTT